MSANFTRNVGLLNALAIARWDIADGMGFGHGMLWWGARAARKAAHNGIDLCGYFADDGARGELMSGALVPALYDGEVVLIVDDFIAQSVFVRHADFLSIYGHVEPLVSMGAMLKQGQALGRIATPAKRTVPAHLHLSITQIDASIKLDALTWQQMDNNPKVKFIDPLGYL